MTFDDFVDVFSKTILERKVFTYSELYDAWECGDEPRDVARENDELAFLYGCMVEGELDGHG